jgi:hypothetical protein
MFAEVGILSFIVKKRHGVASEFSSSFKNIISSLWTLHLCVAKFLQHLPMGISQLIPHSWACGSYHDLVDRQIAADEEVIEPRISSEQLHLLHRQSYDRHDYLVNRYGIYVSQTMTTYTFRLSQSQYRPTFHFHDL